jgi:hypothetical protein
VNVNITKIQSDIITALVKKSKVNYTYGLTDRGDTKYVVVCVAGICLYLIKSRDFMIDLDKWGAPSFEPKRLMHLEDEAKTAEKNGEMQYDFRTDSPIVKIANDSAHAWVNEKMLKMFDKKCTFRIYNRKSPVFIYEKEELVGVLLPVNVKGDSD